MKIAIIGSRDFPRYGLIGGMMRNFWKDDILISGGARGVDTVAENSAKWNDIKTIIHKPDFSKGYNVGAYHKRNKKIMEAADVVVCFWDKKSKGSLSALKQLVNVMEEEINEKNK